MIYVPFFQNIFDTESLTLVDLLFLLVITSTVFIVSEIRKYLHRKKLKRSYSTDFSIIKDRMHMV